MKFVDDDDDDDLKLAVAVLISPMRSCIVWRHDISPTTCIVVILADSDTRQ